MQPSTEKIVRSLPIGLAERSRSLASRPEALAGEFVLYWMHHAVRGHENPALDVALTLANRRRLPVLVFQGLGGRHPYNNDRHHTFILEGARDAHVELGKLGVRAVFHHDPTGRKPSPLHWLSKRAAVVVFEDFPAPPFPAWAQASAQRSPAPVIAVDCACIVPMQRQPRLFQRAYEFRRYNQSEFERRVALSWQEVEPAVRPFNGSLNLTPLALATADFDEICAHCEIDHSIPPVAHTPGGSLAGYKRWERFVREGLQRYARDRNDAAIPWPRGVSRLSPYLHHGHVSPFRIAREALQAGGEGADKFLDELLVWRELAFNFCFHTTDPERLEVLPDWAQETLNAHAPDARPMLVDDESLARSRSDDELWDLAQTSLRIHGELHNNLRMTWAKAIPLWRPTPQAALKTLIELNHRYALDGSDPNSYGGLLWSLGLFDRPFPEAPVTGRLRTRSTASHARRLDVARYRARVSRPSSGGPLRVAVVGAGISGLTAARILHDQGHRVQIFEKARGHGGRAATRRVNDLAFDHGAQYFTARDPTFRRAVAAWRERGLVDVWPLRIRRVVQGHIQPSPDNQERFVATPGMSALGRYLAADLAIRSEVRVAAPQRIADRWRLRSEGGNSLGEFDLLIIAVPAPQAQALLAPTAPHLATQAAAIQYESTWAVLLSFERGKRLATNALFVDGGPLSWAAEDSSKPGREGHNWVLHATPEWSREQFHASPEQVAGELAASFSAITGFDPAAIGYRAAHRWRYSLVVNPLSVGALWDQKLRLGVCGDWCHGARIEGAYLSGQAVAGHSLRNLPRLTPDESGADNEQTKKGSE